MEFRFAAQVAQLSESQVMGRRTAVAVVTEMGASNEDGPDRKRAVTNAAAQCLSCHATQKDSDYVYSTYRD